jgi:hypothetical protein
VEETVRYLASRGFEPTIEEVVRDTRTNRE